MSDLPGLIKDLLRRVTTGDFDGLRRMYDEGALNPLKSHLSEQEWAELPNRIRDHDAGWLRGLFTRVGGKLLGGAGAVGAGAAAAAGTAGAAVGGAGRALGGAAAGAGDALGGAAKVGAGWLKWVIPLVIAIAALAFALTRCGGSSSDGSSGTTSTSSSTESSSSEATDSASATDTATDTSSPSDTGAASDTGTPAASDTSGATSSPSAAASSSAAGTDVIGGNYQVYFDTGSSVIRADQQATIKKAAAAITNGAKVTLTGVADQRGNAAANKALSLARAKSVEAALKKAGANGTFSLTAKGVEAGSNLQKARRVEITIS